MHADGVPKTMENAQHSQGTPIFVWLNAYYHVVNGSTLLIDKG